MIYPVDDYLHQKRFTYKASGDQYVLKTCPLCRDQQNHFYINRQTGAWDCKKCGESGGLYRLKEKLGDIKPRNFFPTTPKKTDPQLETRIETSHEQLLKDQAVLNYLQKERGLTLETIKQFKLGLEKENGKACLLIPHYQKGKPVNIKFRSLPPAEKSFWRLPELPSILFNENALDKFDEIIITEGEIDAISLIQSGFSNVVGNTLGAQSFAPDWIDRLAGKKIYLCYDSDFAGQKGVRKLARSLGYINCYQIELPEKDVNQLLIKYPQDFTKKFTELMAEARTFSPENLYPLHQVQESPELEAETGLFTPWENLNQKIGPMKPGDLIVVSAPPKIGKTTLCLNIACHLAKRGYPVLFYCLEMNPERLLRKVYQLEAKVTDKEITPQLKEKVKSTYPENSLIFGYNYGGVDLNIVQETIRQGVQYYGIDLVVFDNLHFLARSPQHQVQEISLAVKTFKLLADELEIPIILIVQPRKTESEIIGLNDFRDSSLIGADCDLALVLYRKKQKSCPDGDELEESFSPETLVRIEASRYAPGGDTLLYFKGEHSLFTRLERSK